MRKLLGAIICITANAGPLVGITLFGWEPALVLLIYWLEFAVIGCFTIPKILGARGTDNAEDLPSMRLNKRRLRAFIGDSPTSLAIHFVFRFGFSWAIYGAFVLVFVFAGDDALDVSEVPVPSLAAGLAGLAAFHLVDYWMNFVGGGENERTGPVRQFINPIIQILPLHVAIIIGGLIGATLGEDSTSSDEISTGVIIVLVVVKTIVDLVRTLRD